MIDDLLMTVETTVKWRTQPIHLTPEQQLEMDKRAKLWRFAIEALIVSCSIPVRFIYSRPPRYMDERANRDRLQD